jgi:hypothetical protein
MDSKKPGAGPLAVVKLQTSSPRRLPAFASIEVVVPERPNTAVTLDLFVADEQIASWTTTFGELGIGSEEIVEKVTDSFPRLSSLIEGVIAGVSWLSEVRAEAFRRLTNFASLPPRIVRGLRSAIETHIGDRRELWIQFVEPSGFLPLLGWERILRTVTSLPIVRLPYSHVAPVYGSTSLDVAMCCTAPSIATRPSGKELRDVARKIVSSGRTARRTVHLFADRFYYDELLPLMGKEETIKLYEPPGGSESGEATPSEHPWRRWMTEKLGGRAIDVFHTVAPARFTGRNEAFLLVAQKPSVLEDDRKAGVPVRFVTAYEHTQFCAQFGAWAMVFTSFGEPASRAASAAIAHDAARSRPAVVAAHDAVADLLYSGLADLYRFLGQGPGAAPPRSDALSLYCDPQRLLSVDTQGEERGYRADLVSPLLTDYVKNADVLPEWLASAQRVLESSAMHYLEPIEGGSDSDHAAQKGARDALLFLSDALTRVAKSSGEFK